jgi:ribonuclease P protein component
VRQTKACRLANHLDFLVLFGQAKRTVSIFATLHTFKKDEKLKSKKAIEFLFTKGKQKNFFPLKVFVSKGNPEKPFPVQFMVSVPKKKVRSAVKRNRIKRIIREAWRLNKHILYVPLQEEKIHVNVMFMYLDNNEPKLADLQKKMHGVFQYILTQAVALKAEEKKNLNG